VALTVLGLSGALNHDPSAALYIDGALVAAAEEERFVRDKHARNRLPLESAIASFIIWGSIMPIPAPMPTPRPAPTPPLVSPPDCCAASPMARAALNLR
jgi:hypothetical protein